VADRHAAGVYHLALRMVKDRVEAEEVLQDSFLAAYEKLAGFPHEYHLPLFHYEKRYGANMITSRGCPYTCSFCDRTVFERLYKVNSPENIHAHMQYLRDRFGVRHINFYDDLFTASKKREKLPKLLFRILNIRRTYGFCECL